MSKAKELTEKLSKKPENTKAKQVNERLAKTLTEGKADFIQKIKCEFEVLEDSGGGLHLYIKKGSNVYMFSNYEYNVGNLTQDLIELSKGSDPFRWDGQEENPKQLYKELTKPYASEVIVDNDGIYFDKMGSSGRTEFSKLK